MTMVQTGDDSYWLGVHGDSLSCVWCFTSLDLEIHTDQFRHQAWYTL